MTPEIAAQGHSFKGAFAYYLHDKGYDEQGRRLDTSERVEWTETRNLATEDPYTAKRIMIATASQADALKAAAGVKASGQKARNGPVYSYSLSWEKDEAKGVSRADMVKAADDTLKLLKADHLQAVFVIHNDTAHPHIHVIINRVNPDTGKMEGQFTQSKNRLSRWAGDYERGRGVIVTPKRQRRAEVRAQHPDPVERGKFARAREKERKQNQAAQAKTPAAVLKAKGDAQKAAHRAQWGRLAGTLKDRRSAIYEAAGRAIKTKVQAAKIENRPTWAELHKAQRDERRRYDDREKRLAGKVANAIDAVRSRQIRGDGSDRGFLTMAFAYLASRDARRAEFDTRQLAERGRLAATLKADTEQGIQAIKAERAAALGREADRSNKLADRLKAKHGRSAAGIRAEWRAIYQEREAARESEGRKRQERQPRAYRPRIRQQVKDARRETRATWLEELTRRADVGRRFAEARQAKRPALQEPEVVKNDFDKARTLQPDARAIPHRTVSLSTPSPAPSPTGDVPSVKRTPAVVPAIDKAAEWAKGQQATSQAAPAVRRDWNRSATPAQAPAPVPQTEKSRTGTDWDRLAGVKPKAEPERSSTPPRQEWERQAAPIHTGQTPPPRTDWDKLFSPSRDTPREIKSIPERNREKDPPL